MLLHNDDFVRKVKWDVEYYVNKSTSLRRVLLFPPLPSHYRFLIHKVIEECDPEVNLCTLSVGENEHRRTLVYFGHGVEPKNPAMPTGNESVSERNNLRAGRDLSMTVDEISPSSIRERNRRPDKQLYVPKARRLSGAKEKEKCVANDAAPPSNGPRKVLSSVQHKQTEGFSSISPRSIKDENHKSDSNGRFATQYKTMEKSSSRRPSKPDLPKSCAEARPADGPLPASDRHVIVAAAKDTRNDRNAVRPSAGSGDSDGRIGTEIRESRRGKVDKAAKNNLASPSLRKANPRAAKPKPAGDRTIVSNCVGSVASEISAPIENGESELGNPTVINKPTSSKPLKDSEDVDEAAPASCAAQMSSGETPNFRAQKPDESVAETDGPVRDDYVCRKDVDGNGCDQKDEFCPLKEEISIRDDVIEPLCDKSGEESAIADATAETPLGRADKNTALDCDVRPQERDANRTEGERCDVRDQTSGTAGVNDASRRELLTEVDIVDEAEPEEEIVPMESEEVQSKMEACNGAVQSEPEKSAFESVGHETGPEMPLAEDGEEVAATDDLVPSPCRENDPKVEDAKDEGSPPRSAARGGRRPSDARSRDARSSCSDEDSWDALYDENGECLDQSVLEQLTSAVGNVSIEVPQIDYLSFQTKEPQIADEDFGHVVEIYNFPVEFKTGDLISAFAQFKERGFNIKWVNDTHALAVFSSRMAAENALALQHPVISIRPLSQGIKESKMKARKCAEFLQPYKERPATSALLAKRMVAGALGLRVRLTREEREKNDKVKKQELARKEHKKLEKQQKEAVWQGNVENAK